MYRSIGQSSNSCSINYFVYVFNPTALRKAKIVCNFGVSECNGVNVNSIFLTAQFMRFLDA